MDKKEIIKNFIQKGILLSPETLDKLNNSDGETLLFFENQEFLSDKKEDFNENRNEISNSGEGILEVQEVKEKIVKNNS